MATLGFGWFSGLRLEFVERFGLAVLRAPGPTVSSMDDFGYLATPSGVASPTVAATLCMEQLFLNFALESDWRPLLPLLYLCLLKTVFIYRLTHLCFELTLVVLKPFAQASSAALAHASLYFCALQ